MSSKIASIRKDLYLDDDIIAVNAGSWGPLCRAAREAINEGYEYETIARGLDVKKMKEGYHGLSRYSDAISDAKEVLGKFLNCSPDEVALCDSTTTGMNIFLWGYNWEKGDEILAGSVENPAADVPLMVLAQRRGLKLTYADLKNGYADSVEAFKEMISPNTKMILVSDVTFSTGARVDLKGISRLAHENDILVVADGVQAVGNYPLDVKELEVDGYAMARHKFLCGPDGAGALYVDKEVFTQILPTYSGVFTDAEHGMSGKLVLMDTAQRYEVSTRPIPVIMGGTAAVEWFTDEVGWDFVYKQSRENYNTLWETLKDVKKVHLLSRKDQNGLLTFAIEGMEPIDVVNKLREHNIFTRTIIVTKPQGIRLAIGCWNRESDLNRIAEVIESIAKNA